MTAHSLRIKRTGLIAGGIAIGMLGLAYAAVPLYKIFCQVTGFDGTTQRVTAAALPGADILKRLGGKTVQVRFDANVAPGVPWQFAPVQNVDTIKIGERRMAFYRAQNMGDKAVTGTATFNVTPESAGKYFSKIQCFCFTEQTLQPGESIDMPVTYFVDPAILDDPDARKIEEITLSYTFFPVAKPTIVGDNQNAQPATGRQGASSKG